MDEVGRAGAQAGATTMVVAAISKDIRGRYTLGSSTSQPRRRRNSRAHGSSSSSTSRDFRSYTAGITPSAAQPLEKLGKTTPPTAARKSAPPA